MTTITHTHRTPASPTTASSGSITDAALPQLSRRALAAVWVAATLPMGIGAWVVAPRLAGSLGSVGLAKALVLVLTAGLLWQFVLTVLLVAREQRTLRWRVVREVLWLRAPRSPRTGRRGGRTWLVVLPLVVGFAAEQLVPALPQADGRDFGTVLGTPAGEAWFRGAWGWLAIALALMVLNTVLGEELLFRGYLLPRMSGVFGRWAWLANGVAFAAYHVHMPWAIPGALVDAVVLAYPAQRYRSAWLGIVVHSTQSLFLGVALLALVLR